MTNIWKPATQVESNRVLDLNRFNPAVWQYKLAGNKTFEDGASAYLQIFNSYGQILATWDGNVDGGTITFDESNAKADLIPRGSSWQLFADVDGQSRLVAQGIVTRTEAPFPDQPPKSSEFDGVRYLYSFGTPGLLRDPAWRILDGNPRVYDNSIRSLPNAVAAGSLLAGDFAVFDDVAMLYFAPLKTDAVRMSYNTVRSRFDSDGNGDLWAVICSSYDMKSWVGFHHSQVWGSNDTISIVTGSGPTSFATRASVATNTANNQYYTGEFNPLTNTYKLFKGSAEVVSWTDSTNAVKHGLGYRYVGFGFRSDFLQPGVQVSDWLIGDAP